LLRRPGVLSKAGGLTRTFVSEHAVPDVSIARLVYFPPTGDLVANVARVLGREFAGRRSVLFRRLPGDGAGRLLSQFEGWPENIASKLRLGAAAKSHGTGEGIGKT
jgi:hypothetical protein